MVKRLKRSSSFVASDNSGGEEPPAKVSKVSKKTKKDSSSSGSKNVDDEGNTFWDLSNKRRIVVQKFKGNLYVNLREYYEDKKTGAMRPGTKGLMLSVEQYQTLLSTAPEINKELRKNGVKIGDEDADSDADAKAADDNAVEEDDDSDSVETPAGKPAKSTKIKREKPEKKSRGKKANTEVANEEDDSE